MMSYMNICIVTVYNSENCGSHYQALALKTILERQGHTVSFLKREGKGVSHSRGRTLMVAAAALKRGHIRWAMDCLSIYKSFEKRLSGYPIIELEEINKMDAIIIGSDTLWDLESPHFRDNKQVYTGLAFPGRPSVTYAVSIANTPPKVVLEDPVMREGIAQLYDVSVRDEATRSVVQTIRGESPLIVVDPTLLLDAENYAQYEGDIPDRNHILIYSFGVLSEDEIKQILKFKEEQGLKIVSFGEFLPWADRNVPINPANFLSYFRYASCVITNTFHGTAFSIIYRKPFYSFAYQSQKVKDLLNTYGLHDRLPRKNSNISELLNKAPNYDLTYQIIHKNRASSMAYINKNLSSINLNKRGLQT